MRPGNIGTFTARFELRVAGPYWAGESMDLGVAQVSNARRRHLRMSGKTFISYRRNGSPASAGRLYHHLTTGKLASCNQTAGPPAR